MASKDSNVVAFSTRPVLRVPSEERRNASAGPLHVLIIDDTPEDRMVARMALGAQGFLLSEADNGERGLKAAAALRPDCILLDYHLPDYNGEEIIEALRAPTGVLSHAIVVLTSSGSNDPTAARVLKAGALDYLSKQHLNEDSLRRAVYGAVERFRMMDDRRRLEERNAHLAAIVTSSADAIFSVGRDLRVRTWNPGAMQMFGYTQADAVGRFIDELIVPEDKREERQRVYEAVISGKSAVFLESMRRDRTGRLISVEISTSPMFDPQGDTTAISVVMRDISVRTQTENALAASEAYNRRLFEASPDCLKAIDLDGALLRMNRNGQTCMEIDDFEAIRGSQWSMLWPAEMRDEIVAAIATAKTGGNAHVTGFCPTAKGTPKWWDLVVAAVPGADGEPVSLLAASRDITTAKRHEEHIQILMKEVSHRAKNMLGVVQAIARQTATSTTMEEFTKRFSERINSLAASHDLLVDGDWQGVDLGTLVRSQLGPFRDLIDTHFKLTGSALRVSAAAAQSIGMAIHELATNAAKYGALSDNTGCVEIDWDLETAEAGDTFVMSWRERDGPPVTAPSRRGFGSTVINDVVKMSLSADVELEFAPTGVLWRIACPAEGVLDI